MIEVNNLTGFSIDKNIIKRVIRRVLRGERKKISELSVAFIGEKRMKELNKKYRRKNRETDVLSFPGEKEGEVIICPSVVKKNAKNFGSSFKSELVRILIHGILHLLGYDHEKSEKESIKMEKKQAYYLARTT